MNQLFIRVKIKFRAFFITFANVDEEIAIPKLDGLFAHYATQLPQTIYNAHGVQVSFRVGK